MKIYFIGIGGIGVSALAQYYHQNNHIVMGSDLVKSEITDLLISKGIEVSFGIAESNITNDLDLVIYSPAVAKDNSEFIKARELNIKNMSYPEALEELTKKYFTIAISGTHGKSTTTAMLSLIMIKAGLDPTVIIGTKLKEFGNSNFRLGKSKYLIIEADEWNRSFLHYYPNIIILTNIEEEHMDTYEDLNDILKTYKQYLSNTECLILNEDDENITKLEVKNLKLKIKNYSLSQPESGRIKEILKIPGDHNIYNALAALTAARELGISDDIIFKSLSRYEGAWRRFDVRSFTIGDKKITLIDDYAHHPTEIKATLKSIKEKFQDRTIWGIFQPHQYHRTSLLFNDFVEAISQNEIDKLIIIDIYDVAGRENTDIKAKVSSEKLVKAIDKPWVSYQPRDQVLNYLKDNLNGGEVLIILGAGDVYNILDRSA